MGKRKLPYEDNPRSIKYYVKRYLHDHRGQYQDKVVVDFPAGNGITTRILQEVGAKPIALDLFPEYFTLEGLTCQRANIEEGLPLADGQADALICQEGIEHFADQLAALREFNRVLKAGGTLLITTPNYSNLTSRLSYALAESERYKSYMAPNELDSVWMAQQDLTDGIYFGHIFLLGMQKLRVLARLAGFKVHAWYPTKTRRSNWLLLPFWYPFIYLVNKMLYRKNMRRNDRYDEATKRAVYGEQFRMATNRTLLTDSHLMVTFEKVQEVSEVSQSLRGKQAEFGVT